MDLVLAITYISEGLIQATSMGTTSRPQRRQSRSDLVHAPSAAEQAARESLEALRGSPLSDQEWDRHAKRLTEFVKFLSRWDAEQRDAAKCAKIESKPDREWVA